MLRKNYEVKIQDKKLLVNGKEIELEYPVSEAFQVDNRIIVLFDPDSKVETFGQFPNLIAISSLGQRIWTAQLPTSQSGDAYYKISSRRPLIAYSVYSHRCEIDLVTGRIKEKVFYK